MGLSPRKSSTAQGPTVGKTVTAADMLRTGRRETPAPVPHPGPKRLDDSATRRPDLQTEGTYARVTVFLTADQRKRLKTTARALPVDGLSASDVVRLAVNRLRRDLDGGLVLVEALSVQAHQEAATHPGRRNRGLPPQETSQLRQDLGD